MPRKVHQALLLLHGQHGDIERAQLGHDIEARLATKRRVNAFASSDSGAPARPAASGVRAPAAYSATTLPSRALRAIASSVAAMSRLAAAARAMASKS